MNSKALLIMFFSVFIISSQSVSQPIVEWRRLYDNGQEEVFHDVYRVPDDGYIACGLTGDYNDRNNHTDQMWIVRVDDRGDIVWSESYGQDNVNDNLYSIIEADNGDFIATGYLGANVAVIRVNSDGELIWSNTYWSGDGYAIIELKDGNFVITGTHHPDAFLLCIDGEGNQLWERSYHREDRWHTLYTLRETDNGVIAAGSVREPNAMRSVWVIKVSVEEEGETVWERNHSPNLSNYCQSMVSTEDGFVLAGWTFDNPDVRSTYDFLLLKINSRGELVWSQRYDWGRSDYEERSFGVTQLSDGGFMLVGYQQVGGEDRRVNPAVVRTYANGQMRWQRVYPYSEQEGFSPVWHMFYSVVQGEDNSTMVCGRLNLEESDYDGVLLKIERDIIGPMVFYWSPEDTVFSTLVGDTVSFIVRARNQIGLEMGYEWFRSGEDPISRDTTVTVIFNDFGADSLLCVITDDEESASINWHIDITGMYIDSHAPDSLDFIIRRNATIDFAVTSRTVDDDPVEYTWLLNDEQIADDDSVSIRFERGREHSVTAVASQGELSDSVTWQVMVNDLIVDYMPERFDLSVPIDTTFEFEIFPFDENDDSLRFLWTVSGDSVSSRSWLLMNFDEQGVYSITAYVSDTTESDSLTWEVIVEANSIHTDVPRHPETPTLHPPTPNPFNSRTRIRYSLPVKGQIDLGLYDISGRRVVTLFSGVRAAGVWSAALDGSELSSGVYFVGMSVGEQRLLQKVVLVK